MRLLARTIALIGAFIVLACLVTGCDAPLSRDVLLDRLGRGTYSVFTVSFYRYAPSDMKGFVTGVDKNDLLYEQILNTGPFQRLDISYRHDLDRCTITRGGNDLASDRKLVSTMTEAHRGAIEDIVRLIKDNGSAGAALFSRDLYATGGTDDPDYFQAIDDRLRQRIMNQSGAETDWQFVEFSLQFRLPQNGPPVYTAEGALIPLTTTGDTAQTCVALRAIAEREYQRLPDPLEDQM